MMRNFTYVLRFLLSLSIGILLFLSPSMAQVFNQTSTQQCNPNTGGTEIVTFSNVPPNANGDATIVITYRGDLNSGGETIDFFGEGGLLLGTSNLISAQCTGIDSSTFVVPFATFLNWASDGSVVINAVAATAVNNGLAGCINGSSFCVTVRLEYPVTTAPNDVGVVSVDSPSAFFCSGNYDIVASVKNFGTNQVNSYTVNWSWNGVNETPINVTTPLDTVNGSGASSAQIVLGNKLITGTNSIVVWTSSPNGAADTVNTNDTVSTSLTPSVQAPSNLGITNANPTSVDLTWVENGTSTNWAIEYGSPGFVLGTGSSILATSNPYTLTGLTPDTQYDFYVRSICGPGDSSLWAGPFFFQTPCVPSITAYPYIANFDGPTTDWVVNGTNTTWALGTPAKPVINSAASTPNSWVTNLTGSYSSNENGWVEGPCMAFDTLIAPEVSVDVWYNSEFSWDGMQMQYSSDAGATWNKVSSFGDPNSVNWYTDNTINGLQSSINDGDGWTGRNSSGNGSGGWLTATADLSSLSGLASVKFRMVFGSDGSVQDDGVAFDNFRVTETALPFNVELVDILSPATGCGLSSTELVSLEYANIGLTTLTTGTTINFSYYIDGTAVNENLVLASDLLPGDTAIFNFTTTADLSVPATYAFAALATFAQDQNSLDDSLGFSLVSIPEISTFPYSENFDAGPGGWIAGGTSSTWALGTPAGSVINTPASSPNSWMTNLTGTYNINEVSNVTGPCFSFDSMVAPELSLSINYNTDFTWDGVQIQHSLDGGLTWSKTGAFGSATASNWYSSNSVDGLITGYNDGDGWAGNSSGWVVASEDLTPLAGQSDVLFRVAFGSSFFAGTFDGFAFDNFQVVETALPQNLELTDIISPESGCGLSAAETVQIEYANVGLNSIVSGTTINFDYYINGIGTSESIVLSTDMLPGDTLLYSFTATADFSVPNTYAFGVTATFAGDQNSLDDTLGFDLVSIPVISSFPYYEDYESGNGGWTSGGTNSTWALGTPAGTVISSASSGTNAWMTNLAGSYNSDEESFVLGPCFDFTNLTLPLIKIDVNWNSEFSWDGAQVQASTNAGATWQPVGAFGDPNNWYNDNMVDGLDFSNEEGWTGRLTSGNGSGGWVTAENNLTNFAGNSGVLMRVVFGSDASVQDEGFAFDNFHVLESPSNDIKVDSLIGLQSGCGYTANTPITMRITNKGILPQSNVPVFYTVNGAPSPIETIPGPINPGQTFVYNFNNDADLSNPQTYTLVGRSALANDEDTTNDASAAKIIASLFTPVIDSVANGETCESGPVILGVFSTGNTDRWFDVPSGGSPLGTGSSYTLPNVTQDDTLYVESVQSTTGCNSATMSGRVPVFAFHSTTPIINFSSQVTGGLTITFTSSLSSNVDSVLWDFNDGTTSTAANPVHTFPQSQSYLVNLSAYAGSCVADTTKAVFVPVGGINDNSYTNLNVYPNPSDGSFRISAENISGEVNIEILTITGDVVYRENAEALGDELNYDIRLGDMAQGTYILKIRNDQTLINGRIIIE